MFNSLGQATLTFGLNPAAKPTTIWKLTRSTTLLPGSFIEIYRYNGPNDEETVNSNNIDASASTPTLFTIIDKSPPTGKAFYRFEPVLP